MQPRSVAHNIYTVLNSLFDLKEMFLQVINTVIILNGHNAILIHQLVYCASPFSTMNNGF